METGTRRGSNWGLWVLAAVAAAGAISLMGLGRRISVPTGQGEVEASSVESQSQALASAASLGLVPYARAVDGLGKGEFQKEFDRLAAMKADPDSEDRLKILLRRWGAVEGLSAVESVPPERGVRLSQHAQWALQGWIESEPSAAWDWTVNAYEDNPGMPLGEADHCFMGLTETLLRDGRAREATYLAAATTGVYVNSLIVLASNDWARTDPAGAIRWLNTVTDETVRANGIDGIFSRLAVDAVDLAQSSAVSLADPVERQMAIEAVVNGMLKVDQSSGAFSWITSIGNSEELDDAKSSLIFDSFLRSRNEEKALAMLPSIVEDSTRQAAVDECIFRLSDTDPEGAISLLLQYDDAAMVARRLPRIVGEWAGTDAEGARNYVEGLRGIPEALRKAVLAGITIPGRMPH